MIMSFLPARSNIVIRVYFHILSAYSHVLSGSSTPKKHQKAPPREKPLFQLPSGAIKFPLYAKYCLWPLVFYVAPIFSSSSKLIFVGWVALFRALDFPLSLSAATRAFLQYIMVLRCFMPARTVLFGHKPGFNFWQLYDATIPAFDPPTPSTKKLRNNNRTHRRTQIFAKQYSLLAGLTNRKRTQPDQKNAALIINFNYKCRKLMHILLIQTATPEVK